MDPSISLLEETRNRLVSDSRRAALQAQWVVRWRGILWFLAGVTFVIVALVIGDSILQREETGLRWLSLVVAVAASIYLARRFLLPAIRFYVRPIDIARWIDKRHSGNAGQLTVALELAEISADDTRFGSQAFRDAALNEWVGNSPHPKWEDVVRWTAVKRASIALAVALAVGLMFAGLRPSQSQLALRRLFVPWSSDYWPRKNQLAFANLPGVVGHGSLLQLEVVDLRPPLPDDVVVQLRYAGDEESSVISIPAQPVDEIAVANLPPLLRDVEVRAVGGDDQSMLWQSIRVVSLPQWKAYRFEVTLPDYALSSKASQAVKSAIDGDIAGTYSLTGQSIEVLTGSRVRFVGELDRPVESVAAIPRRSENAVSTSEMDLPWIVHLNSDRIGVALGDSGAAPAVLTESCQWTFSYEVEADQLLESPSPWKVEVTKDRPPEVTLEVPQLASIAIGTPIPVVGFARDDWGLRDMTAKVSIGSLPDIVVELPIPLKGDEMEFSIQTQWNFTSELAKLGYQLKAQDQLSLWVEAHDHLGQLGKSQIERWSLESPERQLDLIARRQTSVAQQIQELLNLQATSQQLTRQISEQAAEGSLEQSQVDAASGVVQLQQSISQQLDDSTISARAQIEQMLAQLEMNRLSKTDLGQHLEDLLDQIRSNTSRQAEVAWNRSVQFQAALQASASQRGSSESLRSTSEDLYAAQSELLDELRSLADQLDSNEALARLRQDLLSFSAEQKAISEATNVAQLDYVRNRSDGSRMENVQRRLTDLSSQQMELSRRLEQWSSQTQLMEGKSSEVNAALRDQLSAANEILTQAQAASSMRSASRNIQSEQLGQAVQTQQDVARSLDEAVGRFSGPSSGESQLDPQQSQMDLQEQQLSLLRKSLENLIANQSDLIPQLEQLAVLAQREDSVGNFQSESRAVVENQQSVLEAVQYAGSQADLLPVFQWTLGQAVNDMTRTIAAARRRRIDPDAISYARAALGKLSAAQEALAEKPDDDDQIAEQSEQRAEAEASSPGEDRSLSTPLASLKLIRALQLDLSRQTRGLDQISDQALQSSRRSEMIQQQQDLTAQFEELLSSLQAESSFDQSGDASPDKETRL